MDLKRWTTIEFSNFSNVGVNLQTAKTTPQGTEVQVNDIADLMKLLSHDNKSDSKEKLL
jgi:hypothetical protein